MQLPGKPYRDVDKTRHQVNGSTVHVRYHKCKWCSHRFSMVVTVSKLANGGRCTTEVPNLAYREHRRPAIR